MSDDDAYRVGTALAYLVRRMETFCGVLDDDVLIYPHRGRRCIPERMPAVDVVKAQARMYQTHRRLYPKDQQEILDAGIRLLTNPETLEGFLAALNAPLKRGTASWT